MAKTIIFPVGPITPYVWGVARNFIDPKTASKVKKLSLQNLHRQFWNIKVRWPPFKVALLRGDRPPDLVRYIAPEAIPDKFAVRSLAKGSMGAGRAETGSFSILGALIGENADDDGDDAGEASRHQNALNEISDGGDVGGGISHTEANTGSDDGKITSLEPIEPESSLGNELP